MALDSEEFRRRRQERARQRELERARQKKLILRLLIAGAVLLAAGGLIFALSRSGGVPDPATAPPPVSTAPPPDSTTAPTTEPPPTSVITFAMTGDLNITDKVVAAGGTEYDYTAVFQDILPLLSNPDLTAVNLEGLVCGLPYGSETYSAPPSLLTSLKNAGVDMIQAANSRSIAMGISGLRTSLQSIRSAGMEPLGAYADREDFDAHCGYSVYEVNGIRVGIVAFTKGMDGLSLPEGSESCVNLLYQDYASTYQKVFTKRINLMMSELEDESPDVVIALVHWGSEYNDGVSKTQRTIRNLLINGGADIIIGTHPHYVQEITLDEESGVLTAYSLGDLLGDGERAGTEYSVVLEVEITMDNTTGDTWVSGYHYTPVYALYDENGGIRLVRLQEAVDAYERRELGAVDENTYTAMKAALERIENKVHPKPDTIF